MILRIASIVLLGTCGLIAQDAGALLDRPPAGVEDALKAKLNQFYDNEMQGKFRQAEATICEESKDAYYNGDKRRWLNYEVGRITFEDQFQKAKALVTLGTEMGTRYGKMQSKYPYTTFWRLDAGAWCRYFPAREKQEVETPFSQNKLAVAVTRDGNKEKDAAPPLEQKPVDVSTIATGLKVSKTTAQLKAKEKSYDVIEVTNGLPGGVSLEIQSAAVAGLTWKLSTTELQSGKSAFLQFDFTPSDKTTGTTAIVNLRIEPLGQVFPIKVEFAR